MTPKFDANRKEIVKTLSLVFWGFLFCVGMGSLFVERLLYSVMGHPSYYAAAVAVTSLCYLYCSRFTRLDKLAFLVMLSTGLLSGRAKFFGFYALTTFVIVFFSSLKQWKLNIKTIVLSLLMLAVILFVAREKIYFYFYQTVTEEIDRDMIARYMLYITAPEILKDYFPFGSGFASYGTYASGLYYSDIYMKYGLDGVWGMTKSYTSFIADTYYPSLAQFGVAGILLYITFWVYILRKAYSYYKDTGNLHYFTIAVLIAGFFAIEGTTDSTFTTHRGFFALMLLGMILGNVKQEKQVLEIV
jgi:hypothetical protein